MKELFIETVKFALGLFGVYLSFILHARYGGLPALLLSMALLYFIIFRYIKNFWIATSSILVAYIVIVWNIGLFGAFTFIYLNDYQLWQGLWRWSHYASYIYIAVLATLTYSLSLHYNIGMRKLWLIAFPILGVFFFFTSYGFTFHSDDSLGSLIAGPLFIAGIICLAGYFILRSKKKKS